MEQIRVRAVTQALRGVSVQDIVSALGVSRSSVFSWIAQYNKDGMNALRSRKAHGAKPKLTVTQLTKLRTLVVGVDPRQLRFEFALWTREMVAELIQREFGVTMSLSGVGLLLRRLGMSPQRPLWRAYQGDPEAVEAWKTNQYPAIAAEAKRIGAAIFFQDEASVRSDHHAGTTWGLVGPGGPDARGVYDRGSLLGQHDVRRVASRRLSLHVDRRACQLSSLHRVLPTSAR